MEGVTVQYFIDYSIDFMLRVLRVVLIIVYR